MLDFVAGLGSEDGDIVAVLVTDENKADISDWAPTYKYSKSENLLYAASDDEFWVVRTGDYVVRKRGAYGLTYVVMTEEGLNELLTRRSQTPPYVDKPADPVLSGIATKTLAVSEIDRPHETATRVIERDGGIWLFLEDKTGRINSATYTNELLSVTVTPEQPVPKSRVGKLLSGCIEADETIREILSTDLTVASCPVCAALVEVTMRDTEIAITQCDVCGTSLKITDPDLTKEPVAVALAGRRA